MLAPTTQKALLLPARGAKFTLGQAPVPSPGAQEVLVRLVSAALNPIDWKLVDSDLFSPLVPAYPFICGTDGAGVVEDVGAEVTTLAKGDKMCVSFHSLVFARPRLLWYGHGAVPAEGGVEAWLARNARRPACSRRRSRAASSRAGSRTRGRPSKSTASFPPSSPRRCAC